MTILKKENEDLKMKMKQLEEQNEASKAKWQAEITSNRELILELKSKQSKLTSDLEECKTTDADLVIAWNELEDCIDDLDRCKTDNYHVLEDLKRERDWLTSDLNESRRNFDECDGELNYCKHYLLENEIQKNKDLETQNSDCLKSLEEYRSKSDDCNYLSYSNDYPDEDEVDVKVTLQDRALQVTSSSVMVVDNGGQLKPILLDLKGMNHVINSSVEP